MFRKRKILPLAFALLSGPAVFGAGPEAPDDRSESRSCSTILLSKGDTVLIGHNLDDSTDVPGMIVVNKRGVPKRSISYADFTGAGSRSARSGLEWTSKYGSVTYNVFGKEFPDGGMNERGLYVGEMTLLGSVYPSDPKLVKMYHHAWIQYLLDNFSTVEEVLDSLTRITVDGHCQWHFFVADAEGHAAAIEFGEEKIFVYSGDDLPVRALTNYTYPSCLKRLAEYEGFGGGSAIDYGETKKDVRFIWAADMIKKAENGPSEPTAERAFEILEQLWSGVNRWALVLDPKRRRVWFNTSKSRKVRYADLLSFDFSCGSPVVALDIHRDLEGDVSSKFTPLTDATNREFLDAAFKSIHAGLLGNVFWKGKMVRWLQAYQQTCDCP